MFLPHNLQLQEYIQFKNKIIFFLPKHFFFINKITDLEYEKTWNKSTNQGIITERCCSNIAQSFVRLFAKIQKISGRYVQCIRRTHHFPVSKKRADKSRKNIQTSRDEIWSSEVAGNILIRAEVRAGNSSPARVCILSMQRMHSVVTEGVVCRAANGECSTNSRVLPPRHLCIIIPCSRPLLLPLCPLSSRERNSAFSAERE